MTDIREIVGKGYIEGYSLDIYRDVKDRWDKVSKPLDSMGAFEDIISEIGAIQGTKDVRVDKNVILVFGADNGVVAQGISQADQSITALCVSDIADGKKSVNVMAKAAGIDVWAVDVGVADDMKSNKVIDRKIRRGTRDFSIERAMTEEETWKALQTGFDMVSKCRKEGFDMVGIGEMGIGNTTTSSAVTASLLMMPAFDVTGRGAGLSDDGLMRKVNVIDAAIEKYNLYGADTFKVLSAVGGYDIAAMAGCCIGGAYYHVPIVLDGVISNVAALVAERLIRGVREYIIASHRSRETAADEIFHELNLRPVIDADMALGEGTGAVMMISLIKTAYEVLSNCLDFDEVGMEAYTHFAEQQNGV